MRDDDLAIKVSGVSKTFRLPREKHSSAKSAVIGLFGKNKKHKGYDVQKVLDDITLEVKKGEFFGIVGRNGSGKSTLMKLIAGIYTPDQGSISVEGSLTPFIELGVGFNPELSGRENIFLSGALLGFSRRQMLAMYDDIVSFAELEKFMDQKLRNYSSGMQVRLAFSIAIRAKGDILLLDEVLAVGDAIFQQKCFDYFNKIKASGKTVLLVSHDANALRQYCTNGVLIEGGQIVESGPIAKVLNKYTDIISAQESKGMNKDDAGKVSRNHHGSGRAIVLSASTLDDSKTPKKVFRDTDKKIMISVKFKAKQDIVSPVYGIVVRDSSGARIFASNNLWRSQLSKNLKNGDEQEVVWTVQNIFNTGEYSVSPAVADSTGKETYDHVEDMFSFKVRRDISTNSLTSLDHQLEIVGAAVKK